MTFTAAQIDLQTGIVINLIVAVSSDLEDPQFIAIPVITSNDGKVSALLPVEMNSSKWNGTEFTDLNGVPLAVSSSMVNLQNQMLDTSQLAPRVI